MNTVNGRTQEKQDWIERVINNEILACQSSLVERLFEENILNYDEVENIYINHSEEIGELEEEINELEDRVMDLELEMEDLDNDLSEIDDDDEDYQSSLQEKMDDAYQEYKSAKEKIEELKDRMSDLECKESQPQEVYEWWLVTDWLGENLKELGEPILDSEYGTWWGRTCTGQAISIDYTMDALYDMVQARIARYL